MNCVGINFDIFVRIARVEALQRFLRFHDVIEDFRRTLLAKTALNEQTPLQ